MASIPDTAPSYFQPVKNIPPRSLDLLTIFDFNDDLASNEVISNFQKHDPSSLFTYRVLHIPPFNTLTTGFVISQLALHSQHQNLIIMSNTAPRGNIIDDTDISNKIIPWKGHDDQPFALALVPLSNSNTPGQLIPVFFVNAGYAGSFLKDSAIGFWKINVSNQGTQFRSRDIYPPVVSAYIYGKENTVGEPIGPDSIPRLPGNRIAFIDGFGNIKTTTRKNHWPENLRNTEKITITINGITDEHGIPLKPIAQEAWNRVSFHGNHSENEFYIQPGSSGGSENPFIEIVRVKGNAKNRFKISDNYNENITVSFSPIY